MSNAAWLDRLRQVFDESFQVDWESDLASLNERLGLRAEGRFAVSIPGLPPFWFNGDVEGLAGAPWTLVISLNHQVGTYLDPPTEENYWEFCRLHNQNHWYPRFFRPLVRVAATCLGETVAADEEPEFTSRRMVFVELCPYASRRFNLATSRVEELTRSESGFQTAAQITAVLIDEARPHLLLVNGASPSRQLPCSVWTTPGRVGQSDLRVGVLWSPTMARPGHPPWVCLRPAGDRLSILAYTANAQLQRGDRPARHCWERVRPFCISIE